MATIWPARSTRIHRHRVPADRRERKRSWLSGRTVGPSGSSPRRSDAYARRTKPAMYSACVVSGTPADSACRRIVVSA